MGRKPTVNCWTVITVNGKEFVVEKEFKDGNALKNSAQVNESTYSPFPDFARSPIAMRKEIQVCACDLSSQPVYALTVAQNMSQGRGLSCKYTVKADPVPSTSGLVLGCKSSRVTQPSLISVIPAATRSVRALARSAATCACYTSSRIASTASYPSSASLTSAANVRPTLFVSPSVGLRAAHGQSWIPPLTLTSCTACDVGCRVFRGSGAAWAPVQCSVVHL